MPNMHEEPKQPITVLGDRHHGFEIYRWREALMCFLDLVWAGKYNYGQKGSENAKKNRRLGAGNVILGIRTTQPWSHVAGEYAHMLIVFSFPDYGYDISGNADPLDMSKLKDRIHVPCNSDFPGRPGDFEPALARFARSKKVDGFETIMQTNGLLRLPQFVQKGGRLLIGFGE